MKKIIMLLLVLSFSIGNVMAEVFSPEIIPYDKVFTNTVNNSITFATILDQPGFEIVEYGILYSKDNPDPQIGDPGVRKYVAKKEKNGKGQYGIELIDINKILGTEYYTKPYAIYKINQVETLMYASKSLHINLEGEEASLSRVFLSGEEFDDFSPNVYEYNIVLDTDEKVPNLTCETANPATAITKIKEADTVPGITEVETRSENGNRLTYRFRFNYSSKALSYGYKVYYQNGFEKRESLPSETADFLYMNTNVSDYTGSTRIGYFKFDLPQLSSEHQYTYRLKFRAKISADERELEGFICTDDNWFTGNYPQYVFPAYQSSQPLFISPVTINSLEYQWYEAKLDGDQIAGKDSINIALRVPYSSEGSRYTYIDLKDFIPYLEIKKVPNEPFNWENAQESISWDARNIKFSGREYPFKPESNYQSGQNAPQFCWPYVDIAKGYELIICRDQALTDVAYREVDLETNVFNFPYSFEPGTYYWSVRFRTQNGVSFRSEARRFTILPDAEEYTVINPILTANVLKQQGHPKLLVSQDNLEEFRALSTGVSASVYQSIYNTVLQYMQNPVLTEPVFTTDGEFRSAVNRVVNQISYGGMVYLISQNPEIGEFAKNVLLTVASWDPNGNTAYKVQDQAFRSLLEACVLGYDWLYNLMEEHERQQVREMIVQRALYENQPPEGLNDSPYQLIDTPYQSHGWGHMRVIIMAAIAVGCETDELDYLLKKYLPIYINFSGSQWGGEDGAYSNGFGYWSYGVQKNIIEYTLISHGLTNLFNSQQWKNAYLFPLYTVSRYATMEFGDDYYGAPPNRDIASLVKSSLQYSQSPYIKWRYDNLGVSNLITLNSYYDEIGSTVSPKVPVDLPKSWHFKDSGYVAMHSDLTDDANRISLYFRSSDHGSQNHAHPDQNSFHIQAYGERLAIDSGYYDYYHSDFDLNYTRKTYAHNAITFDGGKGQATSARQAKGKIINYITGSNFDLVSGDATEAYNYIWNPSNGRVTYQKMLDRAVRHIIYVRPDTFVVIDDLKAKDNEAYSFEWWLNAYENITPYSQGTGATIIKGNAALDAKLHYPSNLTTEYSDTFSGPDGISYTPYGNFAQRPVHKRVWFSTENLNKTKIISTINVHKATDPKKIAIAKSYDHYMKLTFEDRSVIYINTDDQESISVGNITFKGTALAIKDDSWLLVDGTYLNKDGTVLLSSDRPVSVSLNENQLGISAKEDVQLSLAKNQVLSLKNEKGFVIPQNNDSWGYAWSTDGNTMSVLANCGYYSLYLITGESFEDSEAPAAPITKYTIQ